MSVEIDSYGPSAILSVPQDAAGYSGSGAGTLFTGVANKTSDVPVQVTPTAAITDGQVVRIFKKKGSAIAHVKTVELPERAASATNPNWQDPIPIGTVRVTGTDESVLISKEKNEGLMAFADVRNYPATA